MDDGTTKQVTLVERSGISGRKCLHGHHNSIGTFPGLPSPLPSYGWNGMYGMMRQMQQMIRMMQSVMQQVMNMIQSIFGGLTSLPNIFPPRVMAQTSNAYDFGAPQTTRAPSETTPQ